AGGAPRPALRQGLGYPLDGGDPRRHRGGNRSRIRSQSHAAVVILRRGSGRKVHGPTAAQHVGHPFADLGAFYHYGRRQMGRGPIPMDPLYLSVLVSAEKKFWRCVQSGETPHLINAEPPRPRIEAIRIVDMSASNSWAEFAVLFRNTRSAFLDHERAKSELKALMPEDAKEAIGHGVKAKRSKSGAVSFDVLETEATYAPVQ